MKRSFLYNPLLLNLFLICITVSNLVAQEVREFMDLQIHTTIHIPYGFFSEGLQYFTETDPPELKYKHRFTNVAYANFLEHNPGVRIFVNGTILPEWIASKKRAKRLVLEQIQYVNDFAAAHPEEFVVARNPEEVRKYVHETDKTIFIHSIEGAKHLIDSAADAKFWAAQGVAFVTLIHLIDDEHGASGMKPGVFPTVINYKGTLKKITGAGKNRGLKELGVNAIRWLAEAGVMTDITHMSEQTREDALALMEAENIPLIATHELYRPIQNIARGLSQEDIIRVYKGGGFIALALSGEILTPHNPTPFYQEKLDSLKKYCEGSIDDFKFTYQAVQDFLQEETLELHKYPQLPFGELPEAEKVQLSFGFQSDFNGWLNHSRPRYGKKGCYEGSPPLDLAIETQGLVHPGLIGEQWTLLESEGVDLTPLKRASEKFLQLWQYFLDHQKE